MKLDYYKGFFTKHTLRRVWWSRDRDIEYVNTKKTRLLLQSHTQQHYIIDAFAHSHPHCRWCDSNCQRPDRPKNGKAKKALKKTKDCRLVRPDNENWIRMVIKDAL